MGKDFLDRFLEGVDIVYDLTSGMNENEARLYTIINENKNKVVDKISIYIDDNMEDVKNSGFVDLYMSSRTFVGSYAGIIGAAVSKEIGDKYGVDVGTQVTPLVSDNNIIISTANSINKEGVVLNDLQKC